MTNTKLFLLIGTSLSLISINSYAEQCTATPDCKTLGYTETSCPDSGVRCPWNTKLMYCCPKCKVQDACQNCKVGMILNSDMTCTEDKTNGKTPIGVITYQAITTEGEAVKCRGLAFALNDFSDSMNMSTANSLSLSYTAGEISGWHLPAADELVTAYTSKALTENVYAKAGGTYFNSNWYWSSSLGNSYSPNNVVNPVSGEVYGHWRGTVYGAYCRPVFSLTSNTPKN